MKKQFVILLLTSFFLLKVAAQHCKDSLVQFIYSIDNRTTSSGRILVPPVVTDRNNNIYFNWQLFDNTINSGFNTFIKVNNQKQVIHSKEYNVHWWKTYNPISFLNKNNKIIGAGTTFSSYDPNDDRRPIAITKSDTAGSMIQSIQLFNDEYMASLSFQSIIEASENNLIIAPSRLIYTPTPKRSSFQLTNDYPIIKLNDADEIEWQKKYAITNLQNIRNEDTYIRTNIQLARNKLFFCGGFNYTQSPNPYDERLYAFFIAEVSITTGNIIQHKALSFLDTQGKQIPHLLKQMYFDSVSRRFLIVARELSYEPNMLLMLLDEQFNVIKVVRLNADPNNIFMSDRYGQIEVMSNQNILAICNSQNKDTSISYTLLDKNLDIFKQRNIKLNAFYPFDSDFGISPFFDQEDILHFFVQNFSYSDNKLLLLTTDVPTGKYSICHTKDTNFYTHQTIGYKEIIVTFSIKNLPSFTVKHTAIPVATNLPILSQELCKQISTCLTPKIRGLNRFCLKQDSLAVFTVSVNKDCKRALQWRFDTTAFRYKQSLNDSTIELQFLRSYKGFVFAAINECDLKDSIYVEITSPGKVCNLGNDTFICPNNNQILSAGTSYKSYLWQDGSVSSAYTVTKPGSYWLRVTDSCDNVYSDTVTVLPHPYEWQVPFGLTICKDDTAAVWLNPLFSQLQINPTHTWTLQKDSILFHPSQTTVYTLEAVSPPGCKLTNTLTVTVNNCPAAIFFPNAFSPNGDGLNDVFKPFVDGQIVSYELRIFNRWGQIVFETNRYTSGWNGVFNGNKMPIGNYSWYCRYRFKNKNPVSRKGNLLLIN